MKESRTVGFRDGMVTLSADGFGTIRNNTALKPK